MCWPAGWIQMCGRGGNIDLLFFLYNSKAEVRGTKQHRDSSDRWPRKANSVRWHIQTEREGGGHCLSDLC